MSAAIIAGACAFGKLFFRLLKILCRLSLVLHQVGEDQERGLHRVVADLVVLDAEDAVLYDARAHLFDALGVNGDDAFVFCCDVSLRNDGVDFGIVRKNDVDPAVFQVFVEDAQMVADRVSVGLAGLCDQIGDIHERGFGLGKRIENLGRQQVRENARIETARAEHDQVHIRDLVLDLIHDMNAVVIGELPDMADIGADLLLPVVLLAAAFADQLHLILRQREHGAVDVQQLRHITGGFGQVALDIDQRGEEDVAHGMVVQASLFAEAVSQERDEIVVHIRHGEQDLAHVPHSGDVKLLFQNTGAASVVADCDDRRHVQGKQLQSGQQTGDTGPTAEYHDLFHGYLPIVPLIC